MATLQVNFHGFRLKEQAQSAAKTKAVEPAENASDVFAEFDKKGVRDAVTGSGRLVFHDTPHAYHNRRRCPAFSFSDFLPFTQKSTTRLPFWLRLCRVVFFAVKNG